MQLLLTVAHSEPMFLIRQSFELILALRIWIKSSRQVEQMVSGICCFGSHIDIQTRWPCPSFLLQHIQTALFSYDTWYSWQLHPQNKRKKKGISVYTILSAGCCATCCFVLQLDFVFSFSCKHPIIYFHIFNCGCRYNYLFFNFFYLSFAHRRKLTTLITSHPLIVLMVSNFLFV